MSSKFCGKCGKPLEQGSLFCPGCGAKIEADPAPVAKETPAQPERPTVPLVNQPDLSPKPPKKDKNNGLAIMVTMGVLAVAVIVLLCIVIFGGGGSSKTPKATVATDYTYGDIVGDYVGEAVLTSIKMNGDAEEFTEALRDIYGSANFDSEAYEEAEDSINTAFEAEAELTRSGLEIEVDFDSILDDLYIDIGDCYFEKGRAKDRYTESMKQGVVSQDTVYDYDLTLYEDERYDYRIAGSCKVTQTLSITVGSTSIADITVIISVDLDLHVDY